MSITGIFLSGKPWPLDNIIAVKLLEAIGVPDFVRFAGTLGLSLRSPNDLSLALGTDEVTLSDLMLAYAPLANGGARPDPGPSSAFMSGSEIAGRRFPAVNPVLSPAVAYVTTSMLKDVSSMAPPNRFAASARNARLPGRPEPPMITGDAWFIGYTPQLITGVWAGYDKPTSMGERLHRRGDLRADLGTVHAHSPGRQAGRRFSEARFGPVRPDRSCDGRPGTPDCPKKQDEFYVAGTQPTVYCPNHGGESDLTPASPAPAPDLQPANDPSLPPNQQKMN